MRSGSISDVYTTTFKSEDMQNDYQTSDLHYALLASEFGFKLNKIEVDFQSLNIIPDIVKFMDDGYTDPSSILTYLICKQAREDGYKVMLSGQGQMNTSLATEDTSLRL